MLSKRSHQMTKEERYSKVMATLSSFVLVRGMIRSVLGMLIVSTI